MNTLLLRAIVALTFILTGVMRPEAAIRSEWIDYKHGQTELRGYLAYDDTMKTPGPGVLVVHEWWGLNDYARNRVTQLARLGYVAFALDMYGEGVLAKTSRQAGKLAGTFKGDRALMRQRARAGLEVLRAHERVDKERVAAIGYCFGGTVALELARAGAPLSGVVSFHGGLDTPRPGDARNIRGSVLVLHGADDPNVNLAEVAAFEEEMRAAGVDWQLVKYADAVHSFTNPSSGNDKSRGVAYHEKADERSWQAMKQFLTEVLGSPEPPARVRPLLIGDAVPDIDLSTPEGKPFDLRGAISKAPTVLIFYRGGWCPYCNIHLGQLQRIEPDLVQMGYQILAISPDRPEELKPTIEKHALRYTLLSDSKMRAAKSFGIAFTVDAETLRKYQGYGIDLEKASGEGHHMLPVPSVFIADTDNIIQFSYVNRNYKIRLDSDVLLGAARSALSPQRKK